MLKPGIILVLLTCLYLFSCTKEETPADLIEGKWNIDNSYLLGTNIAGNGSYLTFSDGLDGTGTDYNANDSTLGHFTFNVNPEATIININDTTSAGGNYNAEWDILEISDSRFRMAGNTFLGTLQIEMSK